MSLPWNLGTQDGHWVEIKVTDQGLDLSRNKEEVPGPQVRATLVHECRTLRTVISGVAQGILFSSLRSSTSKVSLWSLYVEPC